MTRRPFAAAFAAGVLLALAVPVVFAGAGITVCPVLGPGKPDGRIKLEGGAYQGDGTFGTEMLPVVVPPEEKASFFTRYRNTKSKARDIRVDVFAEVPNPEFGIKVFLGDQNVSTSTLTGAGIVFGGIAPGRSTPALRIQVKAKAGAPPDAETQVTVRGVRDGLDVTCGDRLIGDVSLLHS